MYSGRACGGRWVEVGSRDGQSRQSPEGRGQRALPAACACRLPRPVMPLPCASTLLSVLRCPGRLGSSSQEPGASLRMHARMLVGPSSILHLWGSAWGPRPGAVCSVQCSACAGVATAYRFRLYQCHVPSLTHHHCTTQALQHWRSLARSYAGGSWRGLTPGSGPILNQ